MHALPEWMYQVDMAGTMVVVGLEGQLFHMVKAYFYDSGALL